MNRLLFTVLFSFIGFFAVKAQEVETVQPKIMVIPFTKAGEDIRTILENDVNKRITLAKIKEAFDNGTFVSEYLENLLLAARLEELCDVQHYVQRPKQLENYYLTSLIWKLH